MKYNKEEPTFAFLQNEIGDADAYIARISGQRLVGQPDYTYSKNGRMNKCIMQVSGIVVETTGLTRKESKKAACAAIAPIIYGKHVEGKPIPLEFNIAAKLAAANGRPVQSEQQPVQMMPGQMGGPVGGQMGGQTGGQMPAQMVQPGPAGAYMPTPNMPMSGQNMQAPQGQGPPGQGPSFNGQMMHQQAWGNAGPPKMPPQQHMQGNQQKQWGQQPNYAPGQQQQGNYNPGPLAASSGPPQAGGWTPTNHNKPNHNLGHNKQWQSNPNQNNRNNQQNQQNKNPFAWINSLPVESYTKQLKELKQMRSVMSTQIYLEEIEKICKGQHKNRVIYQNKQEQKAATADGKIKMKTYTCEAKFLGCESSATSNLMADAKIQATTKLVKEMEKKYPTVDVLVCAMLNITKEKLDEKREYDKKMKEQAERQAKIRNFNEIIHKYTLDVSNIIRDIDVKLYQIPSTYISSQDILKQRENETQTLLEEISEKAKEKKSEGDKVLERPPVDEQQCIDRMQAQVDRLDKKFTDFTEQANSRLRALQGSLVVQVCADKVKDRAEQVRKVTDNLKALPELEWNLDAIDIRQDLVDVIKIGMDENQEPVEELKAIVQDLLKIEDADRVPANFALKTIHDELQEAYRLLSEELFTDAQTKLTEMKTHFGPLKSWLADCDEFFKFMREKRECFEAEKEMTWEEMEKYEATLAGNQERILEINGQTDRQHCLEFDCQTLKDGGKFDEKLLKRKLKAINKMYEDIKNAVIIHKEHLESKKEDVEDHIKELAEEAKRQEARRQEKEAKKAALKAKQLAEEEERKKREIAREEERKKRKEEEEKRRKQKEEERREREKRADEERKKRTEERKVAKEKRDEERRKQEYEEKITREKERKARIEQMDKRKEEERKEREVKDKERRRAERFGDVDGKSHDRKRDRDSRGSKDEKRDSKDRDSKNRESKHRDSKNSDSKRDSRDREDKQTYERKSVKKEVEDHPRVRVKTDSRKSEESSKVKREREDSEEERKYKIVKKEKKKSRDYSDEEDHHDRKRKSEKKERSDKKSSSKRRRDESESEEEDDRRRKSHKVKKEAKYDNFEVKRESKHSDDRETSRRSSSKQHKSSRKVDSESEDDKRHHSSSHKKSKKSKKSSRKEETSESESESSEDEKVQKRSSSSKKVSKKDKESKQPQINPQMKTYLESLRGWIQRNAKSKEEAWKIFWKSYKDQQKALPTWKDSEEANHSKTARWWFDQAFKK